MSRQGNLVVEPKVAVPVAELRRRLRAEAQRQGKPYGLLFRDISGGFTNTARGGPQAFKVLPILVYRVWVDGRPDELIDRQPIDGRFHKLGDRVGRRIDMAADVFGH